MTFFEEMENNNMVDYINVEAQIPSSVFSNDNKSPKELEIARCQHDISMLEFGLISVNEALVREKEFNKNTLTIKRLEDRYCGILEELKRLKSKIINEKNSYK